MNPAEPTLSHRLYTDLMTTVVARYDIVKSLDLSGPCSFATLETVAFQLRKSIECVAFGCLAALDQDFKEVPRDARGQWNADNIFAKMIRRDAVVFPVSFEFKAPPTERVDFVRYDLVPKHEINLTVGDIRKMYRRSHKWLHEWNPYVTSLGDNFNESAETLLSDVGKFWTWIVQHKIGIGGHMFLAFLDDPKYNGVEILAAESVRP